MVQDRTRPCSGFNMDLSGEEGKETNQFFHAQSKEIHKRNHHGEIIASLWLKIKGIGVIQRQNHGDDHRH